MADAHGATDISAGIREITDEEVAFYHENGWVKLDGLVRPEIAAEMLAAGQRHVEGKDQHAHNNLSVAGVEPYRSVIFSPTMARNAERLVDRKRLTDEEIPLRFRADHFVRRPPHGTRGSTYHQDSAEHGSDRVGELQFWLALAEVTPEMGAMRFLSRTHRAGPLGSVFNGGPDLLELYPKLVDLYPMSPPFHYQPGDATVHHGFMVHGAPPNQTDHTRWSCIFSYTPADTRWWNGKVGNWGSQREQLTDDEHNPIAHTTREAAL